LSLPLAMVDTLLDLVKPLRLSAQITNTNR